MDQAISSSAVGSVTDVRVGFGTRLAAYLIDIIIVGALAIALRGVVATAFPGLLAAAVAKSMADPRAAQAAGFIQAAASWGLTLGLFAPLYGLIEGLVGWSPGKLLLGLRVASAAGTTARLDRLLLRYAGKNAAALIGLLGILTASHALELGSRIVAGIVIIGCFLVLGKSRQGLHDRLAGTAVLRRSDLAAAAATPMVGARP
jgi:uncharacterized RDD family membrane protein YckC